MWLRVVWRAVFGLGIGGLHGGLAELRDPNRLEDTLKCPKSFMDMFSIRKRCGNYGITA